MHTLMVLDQAALLSDDTKVRFAALVHDLGKGTTPPEEWPSHRGHEERSVALLEALCARLRLPGEYRDLAVIVARHHGIVHRAFELKPRPWWSSSSRADAFRRPERFAQALLACEADSRGRAGLEQVPYPQREYLQAACDAAAAVKPTQQDIAEHAGAKIAELLHQRRVRGRRRAASITVHRRAARLPINPAPAPRWAATPACAADPASKAAEFPIDSPRPCHGLEALAHFARQHQLPRLIGEAGEPVVVVSGEGPHLLIDRQPCQEVGLGGEAGQFKSRVPGRLREQGEVHPRRDVLQPGIEKRIAVRALAEVAQQRPLMPLRK